MRILRDIFLYCVIVLIPFSSNGITVVRHLCCGEIEQTDILFFATNDIEEDDHHADDATICCDESDKDGCCEENTDPDTTCGDELIVMDGCDDSTITFLKDTDTILKVVFSFFLPSFIFEPVNKLQTALVLEPQREKSHEHSLSHTNQILRL